MKIHVKQEHIKKGIPWSPGCCPIALAIKEHLFVEEVIVNIGHFELHGYMTSSHLGSQISDFIDSYDCGRSVKPFTFELE